MNVGEFVVEVLKRVKVGGLGYQESQHQILVCWMARLRVFDFYGWFLGWGLRFRFKHRVWFLPLLGCYRIYRFRFKWWLFLGFPSLI